MRNRATLLILGLLFLAGLPASAQQHPNTARGFSSSGSFSTGDVDNVNLFNGNLVIRIPLGLSYPVNGNLAYQLTLVYNNNVWDYQQSDLVQAVPNRTSNAGLGWMVSLGRFNPPSSTDVDTVRNTYMSPDGSLHTFYPTLHEGETAASGVEYTRDGSYLRYQAAISEIEFPDGTIHKFNALGNPIQIRDRFNNQVNIDYTTANQWVITDTQGRTQRVYFRTDLPTYAQVVDRVELTAFGTSTATYSFLYSNDEGTNFVVTGCRNTDPTTTNVAVPLLTQLTLPDGSVYRMPATDYSTQTTSPCQAGMLKGITLPTLGRIEWDYILYSFPTASTTRSFRQLSTGVGKRRLKDAGGAVTGEWAYSTALTSDSNFSHAQELVNTMVTPLGDKTVNYFSVSTTYATTGWSIFEYGLPVTHYVSDGGTPARFLSKRIYDCDPGSPDPVNCQLKRSSFLTFENDGGAFASTLEDNARRNQRVMSSRTNHDDAGVYEASVLSSFDGLGHYRQADLSGNFGSGDSRTSFVNYNPGQTYPGAFTPLSAGSPWVLNTYTETTDSEGGVTQKSEFCFNGGNGFLERKRILKTGTARGATDLVERYTADAAGNLQTEEYFGGDGAALDTTSGLCVMGLPANQYRIEHTYQYGVMKTAQYGTAAGGLFTFKSIDRDIDRTGQVWKSRDVSGLMTTVYEYDTMGRPVWVKPAQDGWTRNSYIKATSATSLSRVDTDRLANGGGTVLAQSRVKFDAFGRAWQEDQRMADGTWSTRQTLYNAMGWKTSVSEQGATAKVTAFLNYDPFGRPATLRPPDGSSHDISLTYSGTQSVARTAKVATSYNTTTGTITETAGTTTELYDRQGRLVQVTEPNAVVTKYEYDVGGRLKRVCHGASGTTCTQERLFTYDNRGFLTAEKHPEKGATGNGTVTYQNINSRGHAQRVVDGSSDLTYSYDRAERLTQIRETNGAQRVLKAWTFGTSTGNSLTDMRNGRVVQAQRYNYPALGGVTHTALVTEAYVYGGREGKVSRRDTSLTFDGTTNETFTQSFAYNELGQTLTTDYPQCTFAACTSTARTTTNVFTNGFLTAVSGYTGTVPGQAAGIGVTYHPNGLVKAVAHVNGVVVNVAADPNGMARPASITADRSGTTLWTTGAYQYDGSGNIWKTGTGWYTYDSLSRIKSANVFPDPLGGGTQQTQSYAYDNFANLTAITTQVGTGTAVIRLTSTSNTTNRLTGTVSYDSGGNLTSWNGATYQYDAFNQLVHMVSGLEDWSYIYTADDERFWSYRSPTSAGESRFDRFSLRDLDGRVLREFANSGYTWTSWEDYIYRDGLLLAGYLSNGQRRHFHLDHLGTPRLVTNTAGNQVGYHVYYPYGEEATPFDASVDKMQFTGHERDLGSTSGVNATADDLDYMHARHSSPFTGRFLSPDRAGGDPHLPQSWNRYAYAVGNPMLLNDPDGETPAVALTLTGGLGSSGLAIPAPPPALLVAGAFGGGVYVGTKIGDLELGGATVNEHISNGLADLFLIFSKQTGRQIPTYLEGYTIEQLRRLLDEATRDKDIKLKKDIEKALKDKGDRNKQKPRGGKREPKKPAQGKQSDGSGKNNASMLSASDRDFLSQAQSFFNLDDERASVCGVGVTCPF
jgi:RHS repeat-associated protein